MNIEKRVWLWATALVLTLAISQPGCQQAGTPPAEESTSGTLSQPEQAAPGAAPSEQAAAPANPASRPPARQSAAAPKPASQPPSASSRQASGPAPQASAPAAARPAAPPPRTATLAAGTVLKARTTTTLSTKLHKTGDTFVATLEEPLTQGGWVIAPKGSTVEGRIVESDPGGRVKGVASLAIALTRLKTTDGQTVAISTGNVAVEAKSTQAKDATKVAIGTGIGAAIGAIAGGGKGAGIGAATGAGAGTAVVLGTRGDAAEIGSETVLNFALSAPVTITEARE